MSETTALLKAGATGLVLRMAEAGTALDIQREYLARARDLASGHGADADSVRVLGLWQRALDAIGAGNLDAIAREIDWVVKYQLEDRTAAPRPLPAGRLIPLLTVRSLPRPPNRAEASQPDGRIRCRLVQLGPGVTACGAGNARRAG